jgi:hypothetical protein
MKLSDEENDKIVNQLAEALVTGIGEDKIYKISHEKMISEIVELMDNIEDKLDALILEKAEELRPQKIKKDESWW